MSKMMWVNIAVIALALLANSPSMVSQFEKNYISTSKKAARRGISALMCILLYVFAIQSGVYKKLWIDACVIAFISIVAFIVTKPINKFKGKEALLRSKSGRWEKAKVYSSTSEIFRQVVETLLHLTCNCSFVMLCLFSIATICSLLFEKSSEAISFEVLSFIGFRIALLVHTVSTAVYLICLIDAVLGNDSNNAEATYESVLKKFEQREHPV